MKKADPERDEAFLGEARIEMVDWLFILRFSESEMRSKKCTGKRTRQIRDYFESNICIKPFKFWENIVILW